MGKAGRKQVETGKFSMERRNERLKRVFDEATAPLCSKSDFDG